MARQCSSTSNLKPSYDATLWHPTEAGTEISALLTEIRRLAQRKCAVWWKVFLKLYTKRCSQRRVREALPLVQVFSLCFRFQIPPKGIQHIWNIQQQTSVSNSPFPAVECEVSVCSSARSVYAGCLQVCSDWTLTLTAPSCSFLNFSKGLIRVSVTLNA